VENALTHRFEDPTVLFEHFPLGSGHHGQGSAIRATLAAAHGTVDQFNPLFLGRFYQHLDLRGVDRRADDNAGPGTHRLQESPRPRDNRLNLAAVHDHDKNTITVFTHGSGRSHRSPSQIGEHLLPLLAQIKTAKREAGFSNIFRHTDSHIS